MTRSDWKVGDKFWCAIFSRNQVYDYSVQDTANRYAEEGWRVVSIWIKTHQHLPDDYYILLEREYDPAVADKSLNRFKDI